MVALMLAVQEVDHAGWDYTAEGLAPIDWDHAAVRIFTVTESAEILSEPSGGGVQAKAVVIDGVVNGGLSPVRLGGGGLDAGRYPVLLSPPDRVTLKSPVEFEWYPASRAANLRYELQLVQEGGALVSPAPINRTNAGPLSLPQGEYRWKVVASSDLGTYGSEEWAFAVGAAPADGPAAGLSDGSLGARSRRCFLFLAAPAPRARSPWAALTGLGVVLLARRGRSRA